MENKKIPVGGTLDYDNDLLSKETGSGFERENIQQRRDGVCVVSDSWDAILPSGSEIVASCEGDDRIYLIVSKYKYGIQYLYSYDGTLHQLYQTENDLVHVSANMSYSDGYLFVTEDGYPQLMLNIAEFTAIGNSSTYFKTGTVYFYAGNIYVQTLDLGVSVGDSLYLYSDPKTSINNQWLGISGEVVVTNIVTADLHRKYYFLVDWPVGNFDPTNVYISTEKRSICPLVESSITLAHPVPNVPPHLVFRDDKTIDVNNLANDLYSYGYSFEYEDGYETPLSPLSVPSVEPIQKQRIGVKYNVVDIYVKPFIGVKKVNIYFKKNSASNSFYKIATLDSSVSIHYTFDGTDVGEVMSNDLWVKESEGVPITSKDNKIYDNRLLLINNTEGLSNDGITYFKATTRVTWQDVGISSEQYKIWGKEVVDNTHLKLTFPTFSSFDPTYTSGEFFYSIVVKFIQPTDMYSGYVYAELAVSGSVSYSYETVESVVDKIIAYIYSKNPILLVKSAFNPSYIRNEPLGSYISSIERSGSDIVLTLVNSVLNEILLKPGMYSTLYNASVSFSSYYSGTIIYDRSVKSYINNEYGVVYFDEYGRTAGVYTSGDNTEVDYQYYASNQIQITKPMFYITGKPSWAVAYQYVKKLKTIQYKQVIVPSFELSEGLSINDDKTGNDVARAIKIFDDGTYGVALNILLTNDNISKLGNFYYEYSPNDEIRMIRVYKTDKSFYTSGPTLEEVAAGYTPDAVNSRYRITGVRTDNGQDYALIEGNWASIYSLFNSSDVAYIQFEITNSNDSTGDTIWIEIGERMPIYETEVSKQIIDYGDSVTRTEFGAYLELDKTKIVNICLESPYINDADSNKKMFDPDRPQAVLKGQSEKNSIRWSRVYLESTDTNGYCVFDSENVKNYDTDRGNIITVEKDANKLYVFTPRGIYPTNINSVEVQYADGTSGSVYGSKYLSNNILIDYGVSHKEAVVKGRDIYFYDTYKNVLFSISQNGLVNLSGWQRYADGASYGKVESFLKNVDNIVLGYNKTNDYLYVTKDEETLIYDAINGQFLTKNQIASNKYLYLDKLYVINSNIYTEGTTGNIITNSGLSSGTSSYDIIFNLGESVDFLSMVFYGTNLFESPVDVNVYGLGGELVGYTKIYKHMVKRYGDAYYVDMPKGALASESLRMSMLYNGIDMTGFMIRIKFTFTSSYFKLYGIEPRYEKRLY